MTRFASKTFKRKMTRRLSRRSRSRSRRRGSTRKATVRRMKGGGVTFGRGIPSNAVIAVPLQEQP